MIVSMAASFFLYFNALFTNDGEHKECQPLKAAKTNKAREIRHPAFPSFGTNHLPDSQSWEIVDAAKKGLSKLFFISGAFFRTSPPVNDLLMRSAFTNHFEGVVFLETQSRNTAGD
ncbi:MAG: hypothetical protein ACREQP_09995 [Candidatus Binatia bacterium]